MLHPLRGGAPQHIQVHKQVDRSFPGLGAIAELGTQRLGAASLQLFAKPSLISREL